MSLSLRRKLTVLPLALLPLAGLTACSSENATTECSVNACTVTFERGVNASATILGVKAELVDVQGQNVTMKIGGQTVTVPVGQGEQAEGMDISVQSVTKDQVVVKISNNPG
ncbi:hypothetical protein [Spirillospora albida]|uniref:hypothetical protein n=1 Tax=Spirillospora albida TaxID=58123 RepID=UPI0004C1160F|nr:hypothetical protein [Spirillospora albida]